MNILEITTKNFDSFKSDLIALNDDFLKSINVHKERSQDQKVTILKKMIDPSTPTHLLIVLNEDKQAVGTAYFNTGTGYSCGGEYLWLNGIYIRTEERQKGYGAALIEYIEQWAKDRRYKLFMSSRDLDNEPSRKLFEQAGFKQSSNISINKMY